MNIILCLGIGLLAGIAGGLFGIGGGTITIPALVYLLGMTQHQAQGTTLALMVPPIGLLAAYKYYQSGNVDLRVAALICIGFFVGGLFGASWVQPISDLALKKMFGAYLFFIAVRMMLGK